MQLDEGVANSLVMRHRIRSGIRRAMVAIGQVLSPSS